MISGRPQHDASAKDPPPKRLRWCLGAGAVLLAVSAAAAVLPGRGRWLFALGADRQWLIDAVTSGLFVLCAAVSLGCIVALAMLTWVLWLCGRGHRRSSDAEGGQIILEFALALPIALMLVLVMVQSSLLMGGNICVHYAAYCAARSAIVQIPDDIWPAEPANFVIDPDASAKLHRVRLAAVWAVMPVSCSSEKFPTGDAYLLADGLRRFFERYGRQAPGWARSDYLGRKMGYADRYTRITMLRRDGQDERGRVIYRELIYPHTYAEHEEVRVAVDHTFYLSVPYAGRLFAALDAKDGRELDFAPGEYGIVVRSACSLTNAGVQDYVEVETFY